MQNVCDKFQGSVYFEKLNTDISQAATNTNHTLSSKNIQSKSKY